MPEFEESGIRVEFPDDSWFRFSAMRAYARLSGQNLKEMDCGWWDDRNGVLWLIELKGEGVWHSEATRFMRQCAEGVRTGSKAPPNLKLTHSLLGKALDSLMILAAVWSNTETGIDFSVAMPSGTHRYPGASNIHLLFVVDTAPKRRGLLVTLRDQVNRILQGRLALFGIRKVEVLDLAAASRPPSLQRSRLRIGRAGP